MWDSVYVYRMLCVLMSKDCNCLKTLFPEILDYPPASEASREVANFTERKNPHTPRIWCQRICLPVCLWSNLNPIMPIYDFFKIRQICLTKLRRISK